MMGSIKLEHVVAVLAVAVVAYSLGKKKGAVTAETSAGTNVQAAPAWWTYASSWQS